MTATEKSTSKVAVLEAQVADMWATQREVLKNTQSIMLAQAQFSGEIALIKKSLEIQEENLKAAKETLNLKADKLTLERLETALNTKADLSEVNRKIALIWKVIMWLPGLVAGVAGVMWYFLK